MNSELGVTKAQTSQNHSAAMMVMTQCTHMVVVFLLCHVAYAGLPTCLLIHLIFCYFFFPKARSFPNPTLDNKWGLELYSVISLCQVNLFYVF